MKTVRFVLFAGLVSCAFVQPVFATDSTKAGEKVLHSFGGGTDGSKPFAGLTAVGGTLYGTTIDGGSHSDGTVFAIDPKTGAETVLYSFCSQQNCADGNEPYGSLTAMKGKLYGTTFEGGSADDGTIYALDPKTGTVTVVYSFCSQQNCPDGSEPLAGLTAMKDMLYGTTFEGGAQGLGTAYAFDPKTGGEKVLYSFCSQRDCTDGNESITNLLGLNGTLYGTTLTGGAHNDGAVFSVDPKTGAETVLYSFCSQDACTDGGPSEAELVAVNGTLYGTTYSGGSYDMGTVFALDPATGAETVLYSFCSQQNCTDGEGSDASLIDVKGKLYGTTFYGGANGLGTVFALKP